MKIKSNTLTINCFSEEYTIEEKACFFFELLNLLLVPRIHFVWCAIFSKNTEENIEYQRSSSQQKEDGKGKASHRSFLEISRTWAWFWKSTWAGGRLWSSQVKSIDLYLTRVAPSVTGWYQKRPCVKLRLHDNLKTWFTRISPRKLTAEFYRAF